MKTTFQESRTGHKTLGLASVKKLFSFSNIDMKRVILVITTSQEPSIWSDLRRDSIVVHVYHFVMNYHSVALLVVENCHFSYISFPLYRFLS